VAACVRRQVSAVIVRAKRRALRIGSKGELQKAHSRQSKLVAQLFHGRRNHAQVLRHYRQFAKRVFERRKETFSRPFYPASVNRRRLAAGNLPVRFKAAKVIKPHHFKKCK